MAFGRAAVDKALEKYEKAKMALANVKEKAEATISVAKTSLETVGSAFGFGYLRGRMQKEGDPESFELLGVSPDLLAGTAAHAVAFLGGAGRYAEDLHAVGNGALSAYATFKGVELGFEAQQKEGSTGRTGARQLGGSSASQVGARRSARDLASQMAAAGAGSSRAGA